MRHFNCLQNLMGPSQDPFGTSLDFMKLFSVLLGTFFGLHGTFLSSFWDLLEVLGTFLGTFMLSS